MTMAPSELTELQLTALAVAQSLVGAGIPLFVAHPDPAGKGHNDTGFWLPSGWENTTPNPDVPAQWRPGMALCAVMGCGYDLVDFDPRNGGDDPAVLVALPQVYGIAATPSGGTHWLIKSIGTGSRDNVYPGIDVKSGTPAGTGRGFAFIAPTVRLSKVTGKPAAYQWVQTPDLAGITAQDDASGAQLAARINELRAGSNALRNLHLDGPEWYRAFLLQQEPQSMQAANRAVESKLNEIREWTRESGAGFRLVLLRAALTLGGYVGGGVLDQTEAWIRLEEAVTAVWGAPDGDDRLWIQQGLDDGVLQPFSVYREEPSYPESTQAVIETPMNSEADPDGALVHQVANEVDSLIWVLSEIGRSRLSGMFRRGGSNVVYCARVGEEGYLTAPEEGADNGPATVRAVNSRVLQARIALNYVVWRWAGGKRDPHRIKILLPLAVCDTALAAIEDAPNLRPLRAVTHTPIVRRDGSILDIPGYDTATAYLYLPEVLVPPVPEHPTPTQVTDAAALVRGLIDEFAWAGPHDEANFIGLLLTPLLRELAPPPYKLAAIMARQPGSGKSLLAKVMRTVHGGVFRSEMPADDAELAKSVTSILSQTTAPIVQFDNVTGVLSSSRLAGLLTSAVYSDRVLGSTNNVDMANDRLWTITGNNLALGGDLVRRSMWITIDPQVPNPEQRTGFKITDLAGYVQEHRGEILHALLVMVRAWTLAGSPAELRSSDDYARWAAVVRGILRVAGIPGEFDHSDSRQQDTAVGDDDWRLFLEAIYRVFTDRPWTAKQLLEKVHDGRAAPMAPLQDTYSPNHPIALDDLPPDLHGKLKYGAPLTTLSKSLGRWLHNRQGRWAGELTVRKAGEDARNKIIMWRVERSGPPPSGDCGPPCTPEPSPSDPILIDQAAGFAGSTGFDPSPPAVENTPEVDLDVFSMADGLKKTPHSPQTPQPAQTPAPTAAPDLSAAVNPDKAARAEAREQATTARREAKQQVAAEEREAKRQAAVFEAAGVQVGLPAIVTRGGDVHPASVDEAAVAVRWAIRNSPALSVDVETSGYPVGHALYELRTVQLGDAEVVAVFDPVRHDDTIRALLGEAAWLHAFSATADLVPLAVAGLLDHEEGWGRMYDVAVLAQLADPVAKGATADGLKQLAPAALQQAVIPDADAARATLFSALGAVKDSTVTTPPERNGWYLVDPGCETFIRYGASDVLDTAALAHVLPWPSAHVLDRERLAQRMVARVAYTGVPINAGHVHALLGPSQQRHAEAAARVAAFGIDKPTSNVEIARVLDALGAELPRTPNGAPSAAKDALKPLAEADGQVGELVRAVLDLRHETTLLGLFLRPYAELCARGDGRARPTVYTVSAKTGRMSCVRPNIQQMPREGGVRACLMADPGHLLISADFTGVEIRVAAALSRDPTMMQFLVDGRDLHTEVALQVFGPDAEASAEKGRPTPHKRNRYKVKSGVFGRFYGGGVPTLAAQMGVAQDVAQRMVDVLDSTFPRLAEWSAGIQQEARKGNTRFESYSGRVIHLPRKAHHAAVNYAVQGTARELLVDTLVKWDRTRWGRAPLFPVHDELVIQVPAEDADVALAELVRCMEGELYGVKIVAEASDPSPFWQDSV